LFKLDNYLFKYFVYKKIINTLNFFKFLLLSFLNKLKLFIFKKINNLYSFLMDNKEKIKSVFYFLINTILLFFSIFMVFYLNLFVILHNFLFGGLFDSATVFSFTENKYNYLFLFISLLNLDNFILLLYIVFIKVGVYNVLFNTTAIEHLYSSFWVYYYWFIYIRQHKSTNPNFSFTK
jgi:hypothetical protein